MRVLVFGDSITWGYSDSKGGWVDQLKGEFFKSDIKRDIQYTEPLIFNLGIGGDTLEQILARFKTETGARRWENLPLAFVIAVGVNDSRWENGKPRSTPEKFRDQLEWLLSLINERGEKSLFVGLTPVEDSNPHVNTRDTVWQSSRIKEFDTVLRDFCEQNKLAFVPVWEGFVGREKELLADGLHPNDEGHKLIANLVKPYIEKLNR